MNKHLLKLLSLFLVCAFASCSDAEMITDSEEQNEELVTITFSCGGELINVVSSSMTKTGSSNDLYLFAFWEHKGGDENNDVNWQEYGYIFTDNPGSCQMSFRKNKKYTCDALCIPNGKNLIAEDNGVYGYPFNSPYQGAPVLNKAFYGYHDFMAGFSTITTPKGCSMTALPWNDNYSNQYNSIDKYFGFKKFEAESDANIDINLYRMMYSITLNVTNFTKGKILLYDKIEIKPNEVPFTCILETGTPFYLGRVQNYADITDYDDFIQNYCKDDGDDLKIKYVDKDGNETLLYNNAMEAKRLTNYDISFDLEQVLASDNMGINANLRYEDITNNVPLSL